MFVICILYNMHNFYLFDWNVEVEVSCECLLKNKIVDFTIFKLKFKKMYIKYIGIEFKSLF